MSHLQNILLLNHLPNEVKVHSNQFFADEKALATSYKEMKSRPSRPPPIYGLEKGVITMVDTTSKDMARCEVAILMGYKLKFRKNIETKSRRENSSDP